MIAENRVQGTCGVTRDEGVLAEHLRAVVVGVDAVDVAEHVEHRVPLAMDKQVVLDVAERRLRGRRVEGHRLAEGLGGAAAVRLVIPVVEPLAAIGRVESGDGGAELGEALLRGDDCVNSVFP